MKGPALHGSQVLELTEVATLSFWDDILDTVPTTDV